MIDDNIAVLPAQGDLPIVKREAMSSPWHTVERTCWVTWQEQMLVTVDLMKHECQREIILWPVTGNTS